MPRHNEDLVKELQLGEREFDTRRVVGTPLDMILNEGEDAAREQYGDEKIDLVLKRHGLA